MCEQVMANRHNNSLRNWSLSSGTGREKSETRNPKFEASRKFEIRIFYRRIRPTSLFRFTASTLLSTSSTSKTHIQRKSLRTRSPPRYSRAYKCALCCSRHKFSHPFPPTSSAWPSASALLATSPGKSRLAGRFVPGLPQRDSMLRQQSLRWRKRMRYEGLDAAGELPMPTDLSYSLAARPECFRHYH